MHRTPSGDRRGAGGKKNGGRSLLSAFAQDDLEQILALLADFSPEVNVNETSDSGKTPLLYAIEYGLVDVLRHLLARGAQVDIRDKAGVSPLHHLARRRTDDDDDILATLEMAEILLQAGAPIDATNILGETPLMEAGLPLAEFLLDQGANIEHRAAFGMTPLLAAACIPGIMPAPDRSDRGKPYVSLIQLFLDRGADIRAVDDRGRDAFALAVDSGADSNVEILLRRRVDPTCPTLAKTEEARLRPSLAAAAGDIDALRAALALPGARLDARTESERTPLHWAASRNFIEGVRFLLDRGAPQNAEDRYFRSALSVAVDHGNAEVVRELLSRKSLPRDATVMFQEAAARRNHDLVSVFLAAGVPVWDDSAGPSPRDAVEMGRADLLRALYKVRDKLRADGMPMTLSQATAVGDREIAEGLLHELRGRKGSEAAKREEIAEALAGGIWAAGRFGQAEIIPWLLSKGAAVDSTTASSHKWSPLIGAAQGGHLETAKVLLKAGADPNYRDTSGRTAAGWAIAEGHKEVAALLQEAVVRSNIPGL